MQTVEQTNERLKRVLSLVPSKNMISFMDEIKPFLKEEFLPECAEIINATISQSGVTFMNRNPIKMKELFETIACTIVGVERIDNKIQQKEYVDVRRLVYMALRKETTLSLEKIANMYGKDHATVINARKSMMNDLECNEDDRAMILDFAERLSDIGYNNFHSWCLAAANGIITELNAGSKVMRKGDDAPYYFKRECVDGVLVSSIPKNKWNSKRHLIMQREIVIPFIELRLAS